jgi:hypothetical protein
MKSSTRDRAEGTFHELKGREGMKRPFICFEP